MKRLNRTCIVFLAGSFLGMILWGPIMTYGENKGSENPIPEGVYIELTKDFYEALRDEGSRGTKNYSNDPSLEYLKEISISSRFMVETNLQILRHQERIIQLLHTLLKNKKK